MNLLQNKVQLIGNVGTAPLIKTLKSGRRKAEFRLATHRLFMDNQGRAKRQTQWHSIVVYDGIVDVIERFVSVGKEIGVTGKLSNQIFEGKDGHKYFFTKVICNELLLLESKSETPKGNPQSDLTNELTALH